MNRNKYIMVLALVATTACSHKWPDQPTTMSDAVKKSAFAPKASELVVELLPDSTYRIGGDDKPVPFEDIGKVLKAAKELHPDDTAIVLYADVKMKLEGSGYLAMQAIYDGSAAGFRSARAVQEFTGWDATAADIATWTQRNSIDIRNLPPRGETKPALPQPPQ